MTGSGSGATADPPSLSVVLSVRNAEETLRATLQSIAGQRYPTWWEVILVDHGSSDATPEIAAEFVAAMPAMTVLANTEPPHKSGAVNFGVTQSKGDGLVFVDADDVLGADYLLHMGGALTHASFVGAAVDVDALNGPLVRRRRGPLQAERIDEIMRHLPAVIGAAMGVRREAFDAVGGFDPDLPRHSDVDLSWRLQRAGYVPRFVPEAVLCYRYRPSLRGTFTQEVRYGEGEVLLYLKHRHDGLRPRRPSRVAVDYARVLVALLRCWQTGGAARFATLLGSNLGRLRGSLAHRVLFL